MMLKKDLLMNGVSGHLAMRAFDLGIGIVGTYIQPTLYIICHRVMGSGRNRTIVMVLTRSFFLNNPLKIEGEQKDRLVQIVLPAQNCIVRMDFNTVLGKQMHFCVMWIKIRQV